MALGLVNFTAHRTPVGTQVLPVCLPPQVSLDLSPHCPKLAASLTDTATPRAREAVRVSHWALVPFSHTRF